MWLNFECQIAPGTAVAARTHSMVGDYIVRNARHAQPQFAATLQVDNSRSDELAEAHRASLAGALPRANWSGVTDSVSVITNL